jgi:phosphocarrier protein HPr
MAHVTVHLKTIQDVLDFVRIINDFPYEVDLTSGRYVVDAKSIMGVLSLDMAKPIQADIHAASCADLLNMLKPFIMP